MPPKTLPIHEMFHTWQGEGFHMGCAAFFIRTFGCPVHCTFCDSAGTWHPNWIPKHVNRMTVDDLALAVDKAGPGFVVVTGGEPAIHDLTDLCRALHAIGRNVHLETSGAFPIKGEFDWITVSPKRAQLPLPEVLAMANEFKLIIEYPEDIEYFENVVVPAWKGQDIWLHPEWSRRTKPETLNAITNHVKTHGAPWRAGWQLHKNYLADSLDNRAAPLAPLGGEPAKGY